LGTLSSRNSSTSSTFCFKPNAINQAKRRQSIKHKNARFSSSFSEKPPGMEIKCDENTYVIKNILEASEEELLLTKIAEMQKILSDQKDQSHNILVARKGEQIS
jgi:hypothetical protein